MTGPLIKTAAASAALLAMTACELGPKDTTQTGYRGAGLEQVTDRSNVIKASAIPPAPYPLPPDGGGTAAAAYQNVPVLGGMSKDRFDHLMAEITQWVAPPAEGCNYCHNPANLASDEKYTKIAARRMLEMNRAINANWSSHVQKTGVTCYTCHRGQPVPEYKWAVADDPAGSRTIRGNKRGQNSPDPNVGYASLPSDPFVGYFNGAGQIKVASANALPTADHKVSIKDAEKSYGLMMHISSALGVNCTYCHNSQSFRAWNLSRAQRGTAYYGIRMVRDINEQFIGSLTGIFPANRKGPHGDPYKVNCATCHQGQAKPLGGVSMLDQAPWLGQPPVQAAAPTAPTNPVTEAFRDPAELTDTR